jgi:hypothetical protein
MVIVFYHSLLELVIVFYHKVFVNVSYHTSLSLFTGYNVLCFAFFVVMVRMTTQQCVILREQWLVF